MENEFDRETAKAVLKYCNPDLFPNLSHEGNIKRFIKAMSHCSSTFKECISCIALNDISVLVHYKLEDFKNINDVPYCSEPHFDFKKMTEYGISYGDIAKWVTLFIAHTTFIYAYDDNEFYDIICRELEKSDDMRAYLADAAKRNKVPMLDVV